MPICGTRTGCHDCCSRERRKSDLNEYGAGSVLYFQFLKYMGAMFLVMLVLSLPAILFYYYGTEPPDTSFASLINATTLGNLGNAKPTCNIARYDLLSPNADINNPKVQLSLACPFGNLWRIEEFGQLSASEVADCSNVKSTADLLEHPFHYYPPHCHYDGFSEAHAQEVDSAFAE